MTDEQTPDPDEPVEGEGEGEGEGGDGDEPSYEELKAERDALKSRLDRQRTQKAREARAAKRAGGDGKAKGDSKDDSELQAALEAEREKAKALETRLNTEQAQRLAAELGFKSPSLAPKLVDFNELVDPSDPDEVRDALRDVLKASPELKKSASRADGGEGGGGGPAQKTSFNDIIRRAAGRG
jgi:hypothetical protein